jgi:hypothetical protein
VSEQRDFKDQQFAPDLTEREWLDRHREVTRHGLARAMQAYALGSMYEGVGEHYLRAADRAMEVLLPLDTDAVLRQRAELFGRPDQTLPGQDSAARTNTVFKTDFKTAPDAEGKS